jgi:hypothetical protein
MEMFQSPRGIKNAREQILGSSAVGALFCPRALEKWLDSKLAGKLRNLSLVYRLIVLSLWWDQLGEYQNLAMRSPTAIQQRAA